MSSKSRKIAALVESSRGSDLDARYLGFFRCFNDGLYFEAHEVLEDLWLLDRQGPNGAFYKGLIQLSGAFVHLQKSRPGPAIALFKLARTNLARYPSSHERLDVARVLARIDCSVRRLEGERDGELQPGASERPGAGRFQIALED